MPEEVTSLEHPAKPFNEEMLIQRIRNGEHDLFYELIRPYERRVYATAFAILRNEADAEDVAQEAVLKAFKHIRQFRAEARFRTWLTQITINEARMWRRKEHANIMEPIVDRQDEEGNYTPRDFADWREIPWRPWNARRSGRSWPKRWPRWERSTAKFLSCAICST
jgi:DNA-directed RNA polymerase specialized sigma24 family protein